MHQYKYLGSIINDNNSFEEEIKARIVLGTKAYYANLKFFKSKLVTKYSKLKLYRSVISPLVTYASETWLLKESSIQKMFIIIIIIIIGIQPLGRSGQRPDFSQATGMVLVSCILGKFLGVACHCFPAF